MVTPKIQERESKATRVADFEYASQEELSRSQSESLRRRLRRLLADERLAQSPLCGRRGHTKPRKTLSEL